MTCLTQSAIGGAVLGHLDAPRDTLLPKLISGEIRITDTERILEGVV